jgi:hypothetical protein
MFWRYSNEALHGHMYGSDPRLLEKETDQPVGPLHLQTSQRVGQCPRIIEASFDGAESQIAGFCCELVGRIAGLAVRIREESTSFPRIVCRASREGTISSRARAAARPASEGWVRVCDTIAIPSSVSCLTA